MLKAFVLFALTAAAEIFGGYAVYLWLRLPRRALRDDALARRPAFPRLPSPP